MSKRNKQTKTDAENFDQYVSAITKEVLSWPKWLQENAKPIVESSSEPETKLTDLECQYNKDQRKLFDKWFHQNLFKQETCLLRNILRNQKENLFQEWLRVKPYSNASEKVECPFCETNVAEEMVTQYQGVDAKFFYCKKCDVSWITPEQDKEVEDKLKKMRKSKSHKK